MRYSVDLLVVGAGPAGLAAACVAAERGMRVALIDDNGTAGGQIWRDPTPNRELGSNLPAPWASRLRACRSLTPFFGCRIFDAPSGTRLFAEQEGRRIEFECERLIIATGARERFLPFPGWTLPNVIGAGALQILAKSGMPVQGKRVVVAGSGPLLLAVACSLRKQGAEIVAICEQAPARRLMRFALSLFATPSKLVEALRYGWGVAGIPLQLGCWPVAASGDRALQSVRLSNGKTELDLACDYLACGFHLVPNLELPMLLGCHINGGAVTVDAFQRTSLVGVYCAGETTGIGGVDLALLEGEIAGLSCAGELIVASALARRRRQLQRFSRSMADAFELRRELKRMPHAETLVCRCEDVPYAAIAEHNSWRSAKLHTRCGMGPCQGRVCGAALEFLMDWPIESARPPLTPVALSTFLTGEPD